VIKHYGYYLFHHAIYIIMASYYPRVATNQGHRSLTCPLHALENVKLG